MNATKARKLLTSNSKLAKVPDSSTVYAVRGLALAPHNLSGRNVCPHAGACRDACVLWFAGRTNIAVYRRAALERTEYFYSDRRSFIAQLCDEIATLADYAAKHDAVPCVRLNTASDINWPKVAPIVFDTFPGVTFYDYTKRPARLWGDVPSNYFLTYSLSERSTFADVRGALEHKQGGRVAVVFDATYKPSAGRFGALPGWVRFDSMDGDRITLPVTDGDRHDVRIPGLDGTRCVVGLRGKGGAARVAEAVRGGFVRPYLSAVYIGKLVRDGGTHHVALS